MMHGIKNLKQVLLPRTLYGRSLMIIVLPILLIQMIVGYVFIDRHWDSMSGKLVSALAGEVALIREEIIQEERDTTALDAVISRAARRLALWVRIEDGEVGRSTPVLRPAWYSIDRKLQLALRERLGDIPFAITPDAGSKRFELRVKLDDERIIKYEASYNRLTSSTTYIFLLWLTGSSIVLMAIAVLFMRNQVRPIHRLAIAAEKLGKGQDVADFKLEGAREVRQAGRAFMEMRDRIRRQLEQRTAMLAGVSHDLRTPLTRMKLQLAMMPQTPETADLAGDVASMEKMLEAYLTFVRGEGEESSDLVDIGAMLGRICSNARRQGGQVDYAEVDGIMLRARPVAIGRAISNIINNACKYATHVWVSAKQADDAVEIIVDDDGPGIPPDKYEDVFKPFHRLDMSRNSKTGGVGLGLAIAQDVVNAHGGEIRLSPSARGGLQAMVRLPL